MIYSYYLFIIKKYINKAGLQENIVLHICEALNIIPTLEENFDLVFLDADKENYMQYYELSLAKLNKGGVIIADNVLWNGKVLYEPSKKDIETQSIIELNNHIVNDPRVENLLLPFRDGLMIVRKKD